MKGISKGPFFSLIVPSLSYSQLLFPFFGPGTCCCYVCFHSFFFTVNSKASKAQGEFRKPDMLLLKTVRFFPVAARHQRKSTFLANSTPESRGEKTRVRSGKMADTRNLEIRIWRMWMSEEENMSRIWRAIRSPRMRAKESF